MVFGRFFIFSILMMVMRMYAPLSLIHITLMYLLYLDYEKRGRSTMLMYRFRIIFNASDSDPYFLTQFKDFIYISRVDQFTNIKFQFSF